MPGMPGMTGMTGMPMPTTAGCKAHRPLGQLHTKGSSRSSRCCEAKAAARPGAGRVAEEVKRAGMAAGVAVLVGCVAAGDAWSATQTLADVAAVPSGKTEVARKKGKVVFKTTTKLKNFTAEDAPSVSLPNLPGASYKRGSGPAIGVDLPKPSISIPSFSVPTFSVPSVSAPSFSLPTLPGASYKRGEGSFAGPSVNLNLPSFSIPSVSLPGFSAPSFSIPSASFDFPGLELTPSAEATTQAGAVLAAEIVLAAIAAATVSNLTRQ
mmetsp:Transcript_153/g.281  ORF Transcript_153/g.281 Transcript_153/m.281 type:complete len:266 (+) Transcript_153:165-962(+)